MKDLSNDVEYMKEYLKHALEMEVHKYTWEEALDDASNKINTNINTQKALENQQKTYSYQINQIQEDSSERQATAESNKNTYSSRGFIFLALTVAASFLALIGLKKFFEIDWDYVNDLGEALMVPEMLIAPFIVSLVFLILNLKGKKRQETILTDNTYDHNAATQIKQLTSESSKSELSLIKLKEKLPVIIDDKKRISEEYNKALQALENIYSNNVLPVKYRNLASVATLYEYLENKRCNTISGPGGIYDTYAHDQQLGAINENLNDIKYAVYKVYEAQSYLYEELSNANEHLKEIKKEIGSIRQSSDIAAENSAISAEASRQSADMLNWFNWTRKF